MEDITRIEDGKAVVFKRGGTYHVRLHIGPNQYVYRTLKTGKKADAIKSARKLFHQTELKIELNMPVKERRFGDVIAEYVAYREKQHKQGRTSIYMIRQIRRVSKFWVEYAGKKAIERIDNAVLRGYVEWRRDYYHNLPKDKWPSNASLNPTDTTLQWEMTLAKSILKWADEKGYRGKMPFPTFIYVAKKQRVRPAFERAEYNKLCRALEKWERDCTVPHFLHTRQLLRDYVLILKNTGMRVGEANNLKVRDVLPFYDEYDRKNYRFIVRGKTGERDVIPFSQTVKYVERVLAYKKDPQPDDWFFAMKDGSKIINLIDQFDKVLKLAGVEKSATGYKYSLYSLRHFYAVLAIRKGISVFAVARNMGTSVKIIENYYAKQATPMSVSGELGGIPPKHVQERLKKERQEQRATKKKKASPKTTPPVED